MNVAKSPTLNLLQERLDQVLKQLVHLDHENRRLRQREESLQQENADLLRKNELAKARVEAIILRLRALEQQQEH